MSNTKPGQKSRLMRVQAQLQKMMHRRTQSWQIVYIGLFTAILAFFILIISLVDLEEDTTKRNFQKLVNALYVSTQYEVKSRGLDWLRVENTLSKGVKLTLNPELFQQYPLFYSAKAQINPRYVPYLNEVAKVIEALKLQTFAQRQAKLVKPIEALGHDFTLTVRVEGHTDARPLAKFARFKNNVTLSTFRAYAVMTFLHIHTQLPNPFFSLAGYGAFHPLVKDVNAPENRRVEIYIQPQILPKGRLYVE